MKQIYAGLVFAACSLLAGSAHAQYTFTESKLGAYRQNFNKLTGTVSMMGNQLTDIQEVYAQAEFSSLPYSPSTIPANDGGSPTTQGYYHFGPASGDSTVDRALGGIASSLTATGVGSVGIRFKNGTAATVIKNLEVKYTMEQWYNSTLATQAQVTASYLVSSPATTTNPDGSTTTTYPPITSLQQSAGSWVTIPELAVNAPSTSTDLGKRDGNAASNRRTLSTTLAGISLAPGQEIMLRWTYVLNTNTNGNGLSIDDVVVTPQTNVFYSATTGDLNEVATWHTSTDGTGASPANFTDVNQTFYVQSPSATSAVDRIAVADPTLPKTWTVSGQSSKIVVGTAASPAALLVNSTKNIAGTIDVGSGSYFTNNHPTAAGFTAPAFTLGTLAIAASTTTATTTASTVEYSSSGQPLVVQANQYGNLKITGGSAATDRSTNSKTLNGNTVVTGLLSFGSGNNLVLGNYDLTVLSSGSISATGAVAAGTGYIVTNGAGRLRRQVPKASSATTAGTLVDFPVGSSTASYTPVSLRQTSTTSDNMFEVRVLDGVYTTYGGTTYAPGTTAVTQQVVNKTWLISKETPNAATVNMTLQWNASESTSDFNTAMAHINHFTEGDWDTYSTEQGVGTSTGPYVATRTGISSFSPFSVSSNADGTLPVKLVFFTAKRAGATVACAWGTASEQNNDHFTVERSADGAEFDAIGTVRGAGSSARHADYAFVDQAPLAGVAYYRLRQTDIDGTSSFSPVVTVVGNQAAAPVAVPNPSTGQFEVWMPALEVISTEVVNVLGARVAAPAATTDNASRLAFDLSAQPAGVYFVKLQTAAGTQVVRVIRK